MSSSTRAPDPPRKKLRPPERPESRGAEGDDVTKSNPSERSTPSSHEQTSSDTLTHHGAHGARVLRRSGGALLLVALLSTSLWWCQAVPHDAACDSLLDCESLNCVRQQPDFEGESSVGFCAARCERDDDCAPDRKCYQVSPHYPVKSCVPHPSSGLGTSCVFDFECESNRCGAEDGPADIQNHPWGVDGKTVLHCVVNPNRPENELE